jgi:hypothetical protein
MYTKHLQLTILMLNPILVSVYEPRLSPQNRPYVISSKPANGIGQRRDCFTLLDRCVCKAKD